MTNRDGEFRRLYKDLRIDDQRRYYGARRDEYRSAHRQAVLLRSGLLLGAAIAGFLTPLFEGSGRAAWAVVAAVLASLAGVVTAYESLIGFPQLEKLYGDAETNLEEAAADWDQPEADLAAEIERVEMIFRSERGQWGQLIVTSASTWSDEQPDEDDDARPGD